MLSVSLPRGFSVFRWFLQKGYAQGVFWAIMICVVSATNDVIMCSLGQRLHFVEISFFRFVFCTVSVLPFMMTNPSRYFSTRQPGMHAARSVIGAIALGLCCLSVRLMPLSENTAIMFAEPLFFLPLAFLFLREKVRSARWMATGVGFLGLLVILQPGTETLRWGALIPMTAAFLFAVSNVIVKKMTTDEHPYTMLFYFGVGAAICAAFGLPWVWENPTLGELGILAILGIGGNLIQVCLFRAFSATDASALTPFRYVEFLVASLFGFLFFAQVPTFGLLLGAGLIIGSTLYISHVETKRERLDRV